MPLRPGLIQQPETIQGGAEVVLAHGTFELDCHPWVGERLFKLTRGVEVTAHITVAVASWEGPSASQALSSAPLLEEASQSAEEASQPGDSASSAGIVGTTVETTVGTTVETTVGTTAGTMGTMGPAKTAVAPVHPCAFAPASTYENNMRLLLQEHHFAFFTAEPLAY